MMCRFAAKFVPFAASASSVLLPVTAQAQLPAESTRMIDVMGTPARVLTMRLDERQTGQPVLFLHGGAGSPLEAWGQWLSTIARLAPVVTFDRPGVGQSPFEGELPTPERVATFANELMRVLDVAPPYVLIGHSWGGPIIHSYAGRYPNDVVGMVYLDPAEPTWNPCAAQM